MIQPRSISSIFTSTVTLRPAQLMIQCRAAVTAENIDCGVHLSKKNSFIQIHFYLLPEVRWMRCKCDPAGYEAGLAFINHFCFHLHLGSCFYANEACILVCVIVKLHSPLKLSNTLIRLLRRRATCWWLLAADGNESVRRCH